jgi:hypothetical protein
MNSPNSEKFTFSILRKEEIHEVSTLVANVFSLYDPFIFSLKISQEELIDIIKSDLNSIIDDKLVTIAKDEENKICGCYAGFKLSKLTSIYQNNQPLIDKILIKNQEVMTLDTKLEILDKIDYTLMKKSYEKHKLEGNLDTAIFCDYYCISEKYFNSTLSKDLALNFFLNNVEKGIKSVYGSFFNMKAVKIMQKYFKAEIVNKVKVIFNKSSSESEESNEFEVILLHGTSENLEKINLSSKF